MRGLYGEKTRKKRQRNHKPFKGSGPCPQAPGCYIRLRRHRGLSGQAVFEILTNSIDEAREGYGKKITVTKFLDGSIEVADMGRGIPVDFNNKENRYNWELVFCEMYAGGKYDNNTGGLYEYSLGTNGLGLCATQYASEYMIADIGP